MTYTATYSPDDNKLRLYAATRLDKETYDRVRAAGFIWAPKQGLFVAPMWTPAREDLLLELAGEIGDEDTSLTARAEDRAERFADYREARTRDAQAASDAVASITDGIPLGQPILVGHHSEKHARKDAERIENGMRRALKMWDTAEYWRDRAAGAIRHAKYKERPDVRARRIKGLEAEERKHLRTVADCEKAIRIWSTLHELDSIKKQDGTPTTFLERAVYVAGHTNTAPYRVYSDLTDGKTTPELAQERVLKASRYTVAWCGRWLAHIRNRLAYERAMLSDAGGLEADRVKPEKGGACKCWVSRREGWVYIQKVNRVTVTVLDNWGNGGPNFRRTVELDKLTAVMSAADVQAARDAGRLIENETKSGFVLRSTEAPPIPASPVARLDARGDDRTPDLGALRAAVKAGVKVVTAPELFPTPPALARRMVELADIDFGNRVLEPSAGTGNLVDAILRRAAASQGVELQAVEINPTLARDLTARFQLGSCLCGDFLAMNGNLGAYDRVIMNPPFSADIKHVQHALTKLKPGGRLVALVADGPRQGAHLRPLTTSWESLEAGTFEGTNVRAALIVIDVEGGAQ